jgi:elongation factor G
VNKDRRERITRILMMHANKREEIQEAEFGDIVAVSGLKVSATGETLTQKRSDLLLEQMVFPTPVISVAIEPKSKADEEKLTATLAILAEEDPTFKVSFNKETGQMIISGMGELHLDILITRMLREYKVNANVGTPQVSYRESVTQEVSARSKYVREIQGRGQFGDVEIRIRPAAIGAKVIFHNLCSPDSIPHHFVKSIEEGVRESLKSGPVAGYEVIDVEVELVNGSYSPTDSTDLAFKIATGMAVDECLRKAKAVLLEPVMKAEIITPPEFTGEVISDLGSRRSKINGIDDFLSGVHKLIRADVPLSEMFGYSTSLRSLTQGRATYNMQFAYYSHVPENIEKKILGF